jgi:integrase/recombinase XerD
MEEREILKIKVLVAQFSEHLTMENYSPCTIWDYEKGLKDFLRYLQTEDVPELAAVTGETLYRYQLHVYQETYKGKRLSLLTQRGRLVAVRSFFRYLLRRGRVLSDPASGLELPKQKKGLPRGIMTAREINKILAQPDLDTPLGLRDRAMLETFYSTGMRTAELQNLTVHDADLGQGELRIEEGKGRRGRVVPLGEVAAHYVGEYLERGRPALGGALPEAGGRLFISRYGKKLESGAAVNLRIRAYLRQAGIVKHVTAHGFRHTCATHMLRGGASLRHIQALLGHRSLETTQLYTRVELGDLKREHRRTHPREQIRGT